MWTTDDDDDADALVYPDDGSDGDGEDDDELVARVEAVFREERARITSATDPNWLRGQRAAYEEAIADGSLYGVGRLRAGDLIDLIDVRLPEVEAASALAERTSAQESAAEIARLRAELRERDRRDREAMPRRDAERERDREQRAVGEHEIQQRARRAEADQRAASARLANAQAAETEARVALLRAQAAREARAPAPRAAPIARSAARPRPSDLERAIAAPVAAARAAVSRSPIEQADREALVAAGHWPPAGPLRDHAAWCDGAGWPKAWTLKGGHIASLRERLGLTQDAMAAQLGVPSDEVARAESERAVKVRPALQVSLRRAILEYQSTAKARAVASARPAADAAPAPVTTATSFTGADLSQFRRERGLSQRQVADLLGVAHGTVAKAELLPRKPLGKKLQHALGLARQGR